MDRGHGPVRSVLRAKQINTYPEILADPQIAAMELLRRRRLPNGVETWTTAFPVSISGYRFEAYREPPELGRHNAAMLADWLDKKA